MANLLREGSRWLNQQRNEHMTDTIGYFREGHPELSISATPGRTVFDQADENGLILQFKSKDFIIQAADLVLGGSVSVPIKGDEVAETDADGTRHVYEVIHENNGPVFEYADEYRISIRIHTKKIRTEAP